RRVAVKRHPLGWLFGRRQEAAPPVRGLYIHGAVGRGKTMLMDLFFQTVSVRRKRRAHFHEFMADIHERVHRARKAPGSAGDPILPVAEALAEEVRLL